MSFASLRRAAMFAASVIALVVWNPAQARGQPAATAETVRDFMIQNVCLDESGAVRIGRSPLDGEAGCPRQRDLRPGEPLPYHKHDHPSPDHRAGAPLGYQRHDSYPVETKGLGTVVEHSFDFGTGGRRFGVFDRGSDGGDVAIISSGISSGAVSFGATEDAGGFALWVGECRGAVGPEALRRSWLIVEFDPNRPAALSGRTVARLNAVRGNRPECPTRLNAALTTWRLAPFAYRTGPGQGPAVTLTSLISDHYGGGDRDTADHVERFYFTRELGGTRWERWQNARGNKLFSAALIAERAAAFAASGRCGAAEPPAGNAPMVLIDCREWTRIVPPDHPAGDAPGFWIEAIRARPGAPEFFSR
ncbi:MAG: hypothetical protein AB7H71_09085 [Alphaproteobacteria bacterium]